MKIRSNRSGNVLDVADWFGDRKVESGRYERGSRSRSAPNQSDTKDAWVDHAVSQGMDRAEAEAATKADLADRFGD